MKKIKEWFEKCTISKKKKIVITIILILVIFVSIFMLMKNSNTIENARVKTAKETEGELINLNVDIKEETNSSYKCLLTFTSNDENEKIKSIEYPAEDGKEKQIIKIGDEQVRKTVAIDYIIEKNKEYGNFKVTTISNNVIELTPLYKIKFKVFDEIVDTVIVAKGRNYNIVEEPVKEDYTFYGWTKDENAYIAEYTDEYFYQEKDNEVTLNAIMRENKDVSQDSLLKAVEDIDSTCQANITVKDETYTTDFMTYDGDLVLDGTSNINGATLNEKIYEFGNEYTDTPNATEDAKNMVILKINGNLTINEGITLTTCKNSEGYGGPKGLFIYCTGTIKNNGIIDMTARGTRAEGQNVYLWKNTNDSYEYVPATGATGGDRASNYTSNKGANGNDRQTAGGGSGGGRKGGIGGAGRNRNVILRWHWRWSVDIAIL